jgi:hypothetical protein
MMLRHKTTDPGYRNQHGQVVVSRTGFPSESFPGQTIYRMRCDHCGYEYGSNGTDIHSRLCPSHQGGVRGEILRDPPPNLFST